MDDGASDFVSPCGLCVVELVNLSFVKSPELTISDCKKRIQLVVSDFENDGNSE